MNPEDRIEKNTSLGEFRRAATSFFASLCLFGMATVLYFGGGGTFFSFIAIVPALTGLLLVYNGIHSLFASKTPPTSIILNTEPLPRGSSIGVVIRQAGPVRLHSLRANLVCERIKDPTERREVSYPHQLHFFDSGRCEIARLDVQEFQATFVIPADAEPSRKDVVMSVAWRIEIWGKVDDGADFMRPFEVEVV